MCLKTVFRLQCDPTQQPHSSYHVTRGTWPRAPFSFSANDTLGLFKNRFPFCPLLAARGGPLEKVDERVEAVDAGWRGEEPDWGPGGPHHLPPRGLQGDGGPSAAAPQQGHHPHHGPPPCQHHPPILAFSYLHNQVKRCVLFYDEIALQSRLKFLL